MENVMCSHVLWMEYTKIRLPKVIRALHFTRVHVVLIYLETFFWLFFPRTLFSFDLSCIVNYSVKSLSIIYHTN